MSFATVNQIDNAVSSYQDSATLGEIPSKLKYKSYKKKFLKMRHHFKERMRENGRLYEEEQHATRIVRRLQEQNDQILELLLDVNEQAKIPPYLRYDLRSPTPTASDVPALEPDIDPMENREVEGAQAALKEARAELDAGLISLQKYRDFERQLFQIIESTQNNNPPKSLADLSRISHTRLAYVPASGMPADLVDESPVGYLSPSHEDEYLSALDTHLQTAPPESRLLLPRESKPTEKEKERDAQINNPVSVQNWLRAHADSKPVAHDIEKEAAPSNPNIPEPSSHKPKPSPKPSSVGNNSTIKTSRKRASSALTKPEPGEEELLDDEGYVIGDGGGVEVPLTKGKRKRDGDDAYRPKGGSSKSRKRTKGSGGATLKKLEPEAEEEEVEV